MNSGLLSQDEIDALLNGVKESPALSESDKDLLGEIGNISMGSASTALSTIINKMVNITTPKVALTSLDEIKAGFDVPNIALEVEFTEGLTGANLLVIKLTDAAVIADLMMGGTGETKSETLTEIELSAVSEAMNQMVGSAATSLSTMLNTAINIAPPIAKVWDDQTQKLSSYIDENEQIVRISFRLTIDVLVDSEIMLILPIETSRILIDRMSGGSDEPYEEPNEFDIEQVPSHNNTAGYQPDFMSSGSGIEYDSSSYSNRTARQETYHEREAVQPVNVQRAQFAPLTPLSNHEKQNIDLILDVPLEISVVLGRAKKSIKEILELGTGSLIELDKLTEEPVEILVNGKKVALGEVVVIDENFGVRITSIISNTERVKSLQSK